MTSEIPWPHAHGSLCSSRLRSTKPASVNTAVAIPSTDLNPRARRSISGVSVSSCGFRASNLSWLLRLELPYRLLLTAHAYCLLLTPIISLRKLDRAEFPALPPRVSMKTACPSVRHRSASSATQHPQPTGWRKLLSSKHICVQDLRLGSPAPYKSFEFTRTTRCYFSYGRFEGPHQVAQ